MPVLVSNQTSNTNNEEQVYEQEESSSPNGVNSQTASNSQNEPVVKQKYKIFVFTSSIFQEDLFKILDEPSPQTNGGSESNAHNNFFDSISTSNQQQNPLETILFGDDLTNDQSTNGKIYNSFSIVYESISLLQV